MISFLSLGIYPKIKHAGVYLDKIWGRRSSGRCWQWWWLFQHTVESSGGQWCLRGSAVTTHSVSLHHTLLIFPYSLFAPQHPPLLLSRILPVTSPLKRATHLLTLIPASRPHLTQRSPPRWPHIDHSLTFCRLFSLSAAADALRKALIIQWHSS